MTLPFAKRICLLGDRVDPADTTKHTPGALQPRGAYVLNDRSIRKKISRVYF